MTKGADLHKVMERFRTTATRLKRRNGTEGDAGDEESIFGRWRRWSRRAYHAQRQYGPQVTELTGLSRARQAYELFQIQRRWGFETKHYFRFHLFRREIWEEASLFVPQWQMQAFSRFIVRHINSKDETILSDKAKFRDHCLENGLSSIPTVGVFRDGELEWGELGKRLPKKSLFAKPISSFGGEGAMFWEYKGDSYSGSDGKLCSEGEVVGKLRKKSNHTPYLLQVGVGNHDSLQNTTGNTLVSIRIITVCTVRDSKVGTVGAMIKLPAKDTIVSNTTAGAFVAPVEMRDGCLGKAVNPKKLLSPLFSIHPVTQQEIEGGKIPMWSEAVELVQRAHDTLQDVPLVGWDVAVTPEGPILIEGNIGFGVEAFQGIHQTPLAKMGIPQRALAFVEETS